MNEKRCDVEFNVEVRDHLRGAHTLVSQANEVFAGAQVNDNGLIVSSDNAPLALKVSKGSLRRALLIMDALLKAFEERGYQVVAGPKVEVEGVKVSSCPTTRSNSSGSCPSTTPAASHPVGS